MGPGPLTGSPNFHPPSASHEVLLFNQPKTNGTASCVTGIQKITFDDSSTLLSSKCCRDHFNGVFKPEGRLAEFIGAPPSAQWTLVAQDMKMDALGGAVLGWEISFVVSPCVRSYTWQNLVSTGSDHPPARCQAKAIAYGTSFFVFGGRDINDNALNDLYRFDTSTNSWTLLTPFNFNIALETSSSVGSNFLLTSFGLMRYGGYFRLETMPSEFSSYTSDVHIQDPVTLRWKQVQVQAWPFRDSKVGAIQPQVRYLSAAAYVATNELSWQKAFGYRGLFDQPIPSSYSNYIGALADSILLYGGHDGTENDYATNDPSQPFGGSSGGFLTDMWMLRLANWSTAGARDTQQAYITQNCRWRKAASATGAASCLSASGSSCDLRSLLLLAWCSQNNQTVA